MPDAPPPRPAAGGFPIAIGAIIGAAIGFSQGQPTVGFLIGTAIGIGAAVAIWLLGKH